jgi:hypothetical protein
MSDRPARVLITIVPARLKQMFFETGLIVPQGTVTAQPPTKQEIEKQMEAAPRYGMKILVPEH